LSVITSAGAARLAAPRGLLVGARWSRPLAFGLTVAVLGFATWELALTWDRAAAVGQIGGDLAMYLDATRRWLAGGSFYPAAHLTAPYVLTGDAILYPPTTIPLFAAFLLIPAAVFWVVPVVVVGWVVLRHRPAPWTWPLIAACLAYTPTLVKVVHGNPIMWVAAAVALGTVYAWPAIFVLLKPSVAPFALVGATRRSWWLALAGFGATALLFAPLWIDYVTVLANARGPLATPLYSLGDMPILLVPLLARWTSTREPYPARG
jgi:hypothetical protein